MFLFLLLACGGDHAPTAHEAGHEHGPAGHEHGTPAAAGASAAAGHAHEGGAAHGHEGGAAHGHEGGAAHAHEAGGGHGAAPHAHSSSHGGEIKTVGDLHVEARFMRSGVMVWVTDAQEKPVDLATVTAGAVVKGAAGIQSVPMAVMGDHLHAALTLPEGTAADAVITLTYGGKPVSVDFRTTSVGSLAEHDHTSLHGGVVSMWGDFHVEYLAKGGEVRFWVSDARRLSVTEGVSGSARVGAVTVPLTLDVASGALVGKATPAQGEGATVDVKVGDKAFSLAF